MVTVHDRLKNAISRRYEAIKSTHANEGRRRWILRVLYESWSEITASDVAMLETDSATSYLTDPDPFDEFSEDEELGLIIRTDFTDDDAWRRFCQTVNSSQVDFLSELRALEEPENKDTDSTVSTTKDADSDSSQDSIAYILKTVDPPDQSDRRSIKDMSNIHALRLFNDVDIRMAPPPQTTGSKLSYQNPLIDQDGWQEIYSGKQLWIYDSRSNLDQSARVVSQAGDFYGTGTGDSWRARALHICELQFNMTYQGLKIDFNGMDRWDQNERARNLAETAI